MLFRQRFAYRDEIIARVETLRDRPDRLPQRLAIAEIGRTGELIDLGTAIVDVVLAGDGIAHCFEEVGERVAEDRTAGVPDMHRAGGVGRDVLDIDLRPTAPGSPAIGGIGLDQRLEHAVPIGGLQSEVDEAGAGDLRRIDILVARQRGGDAGGKLARLGAERLREHHRRIDGEVAMRGFARRFDDDAIEDRGLD